MNKIILVFALSSLVIYSSQKFTPVKSVNLTAYEGDWREVAYTPIIGLTFERDGFCVNANYKITGKNEVTVNNTMRIGSK